VIVYPKHFLLIRREFAGGTLVNEVQFQHSFGKVEQIYLESKEYSMCLGTQSYGS
jgi:hypothetical protein